MNVQSNIRKLARSTYYQNLYSIGKELPYLRIFKNTDDFSVIQMMFLRYLNYYYSILMDIELGEVDEIVLDNEIYSDSYIMYKNKKDTIKRTTNQKKELDNFNSSRWIFKTPIK